MVAVARCVVRPASPQPSEGKLLQPHFVDEKTEAQRSEVK